MIQYMNINTHSELVMPEFTFKALLTGVLLGIIFGSANAYLGLRVGMTISASIPAAVMTIAVFKFLSRPSTILEANLSQTVASASTALATGTLFTIPALFLWGVVPPYIQIVSLCFLGGLLGLCAMIPLRRLLIVSAAAELPYPEGRACAEVLQAADQKSASSRWIFWGMLLGAILKVSISLLFLWPDELQISLPVLPKAELALELAPALIGVGYILGYRQAAVCVAGALLSAVVLTPLISIMGAELLAPHLPETVKLISDMDAGEIWSRYVRYIGAGAVATAGILTVIGTAPLIWESFRSVAKGIRRVSNDITPDDVDCARRDRDLPRSFVFGGIAFVILIAGLVPSVFAGEMNIVQRGVLAVGVGFFGLLFVSVAARIVGIVGVSSQPTSGIALVTLLGTASVFAAAGWVTPDSRAAVLTVGTIVAIAASKAGDIAQDLKTGFLLGATPAHQQLGQLIGAAAACWAVAATVLLLGNVYGFGSHEIPAPQATLMKTIVEGVLSGDLPWDLVATGAGLAMTAMLCGVSGLAFAIGVYLPLGTMTPLFVGGCVRAWIEWRTGDKEKIIQHSNSGVLAAAGLIAGEGLAGVLIAGLVTAEIAPRALTPIFGAGLGQCAVSACVLGVGLFLMRAGRSL